MWKFDMVESDFSNDFLLIHVLYITVILHIIFTIKLICSQIVDLY